MHTIKLLLTYYLNISIQAANLPIAESNRIEKIDSVARIESNRNFFARIGMPYCCYCYCYYYCYYILRQKKGTNILLCASLLILDRNW